MGAIRERMIEELELRGMSAATKKSYLVSCRLFVAHFMKSPEQLGADDIKAFLLNLMRERRVGPSCVRGYIAAISFLYRNVLRNPGVVEDLPYPRVPKTLPDVLSREEVQQLLGAVRSTIHRTILMVAYGAGLRISEALRLQVRDIDSKRMVIHIRGAKQAKDRFECHQSAAGSSGYDPTKSGGSVAPAAFGWPPPWSFSAIFSASPLRLRRLAMTTPLARRKSVSRTGYFVACCSRSW